MTTRSLCVVVGMLLVIAMPMTAQANEGPLMPEIMRLLTEIRESPLAAVANLSDEELEQIESIEARTTRERRESESEIAILRAQIERELINEEPDLGRVEELMREVLEWELQIRMGEIRKELEIRGIIGNERWAQFLQSRRILRQVERLSDEFDRRAEGEERRRDMLREANDFFNRRLGEIQRGLGGAQRELRERIERLRRELSERSRRR